jgi:peptidoglycan-associated lipoprotein
MKTLTKATLLVLALAVAGCASRGGTGGAADGAGFDGGMGGGFSGGDAAGLGTGAFGASTLPGTNIADRVFFAVDQATLSAEATATLNAQIAWLQQNPAMPILVEGHADERGTREYNLALGARRASAVRNYMVAQGIPDARVSTITFGRERPVATCADESCWTANRRAVTVVTGGPGV